MTTSTAAARPSPLPPRPYHFPAFERRRLDNGAQVVIAPARKLPLATVCLVAEAGAVSDPPGREGVAQLTGDLLLEGSDALTGAEIAERFERLGATVEVETQWDVSVISVTALRQHLDDAVHLLGDVVRAPSFPEREVERLKSERRAELLRQHTEPRGLADDMFSRVLYGSGSRFTRPIGGTVKSVDSITRADVRGFYESRYRAGGLTVVIAGDVSLEDGERLARAVFGGWRGGAANPVSTSDAPASRVRGLHLVGKADAQQAELRIGHVGVPRNHPDYYPIVIMNAVLGGLFSSRINLNLRERHGYTYGAFSRFDWRRQAGPFAVSTAVQTEVSARAAHEVIAEIDRIRQGEVGADELSLATSYLDGVFPIRFETTDSIADALVTLTAFGLPDDFHDQYRERIRAVSTSDVLHAAQKYLHPESLQLLVVGDEGALRTQMEGMQFAPIALHGPTDET
ncbi:MAG TPA: pitrilysin family protein [Gemmatimonadaceae bacterium]